MGKYISPILIILALSACSKERVSTGILSFGIKAEEISISSTKSSSAVPTKALSDEDLNKFVVEIPGTDIPSGYYENIKGEKFVVTADTYTAVAYSCSNDVANGAEEGSNKYGCIRYAGEKEFTVAPGELANVIIPCRATNSKVSVQLKKNFLKALKMEATIVTISTEQNKNGRSLTFGNFTVPSGNSFSNIASEEKNWAIAMQSAADQTNAENIQYAFYPAETTLYIGITSQKIGRPASETVEFTVAQPIVTLSAHWHKITIDADLSNAPTGISIKVDEIIDVVDNGFSIDKYNSGSLTEDI